MLPTVQTTVEKLANAIWHGFEFFPSAMPTATCEQYLLSLLFLRALSPMQQPESASRPAAQKFGLLVPQEAQMSVLFTMRGQPGNGARIDRALDALTFLNPAQLGTKLVVTAFDSPLLGGPLDRDARLSALLCHFAQAELQVLDQQPDLFAEVFSEVLRLFASYHHASAQYFTSPQADIEQGIEPRPVAQLMARLLDPMPNDAIYDPACGTGSLLLACAQWIKQVHQGEPRVLFGMELNVDRCALARMQLVLYGMDSTHLVNGDALARAAEGEALPSTRCPRLPDALRSMSLFDVVLSAPPIVAHPNTVEQDAKQDINQDANHKPLKRAGLGFALTMLSRLQPNTGRMAVLLPVSALVRSDQREMREELVRANAMDSVIFLPPCLLQHYPEPAAIVLMRRSHDDAPVYIVDARQLGLNVEKLTMQFARPFLDKVIAEIAQAFLPKRDVPGFSRLVTLAELAQVKYDFTGLIASIAPIAQSTSGVLPTVAQELSSLLSIA